MNGDNDIISPIIRQAVKSDAAILAVIAEDSGQRGWSEKAFADACSYEQAAVLVCESGEDVLGYVILYFASDEGEIPSIAVDSRARRKGVGTFLINAVSDLAQTLGVEKIFLEVRTSNHPARQLYVGTGFSEAGLRKGFYTDPYEDGIVMIKLMGYSSYHNITC